MVRCNVKTIGQGSGFLFGVAGMLALSGMAQAQTTVKTATLTPAVAQQLAQVSQTGIAAGVDPYEDAVTTDTFRQGNTVDIGGHEYPFAIRLGAMVSPRVKFVGGADLTLRSLGIAPHWAARVDAEAIVSANFGGTSTVVPLTFDEVYLSPNGSHGFRPYAGFGIGPYFASTTRFGGKLFVGARFSQRIAGEAAVHFPGAGDALLILSLRTSL
jgi:hypothetical protein